ncbi:MAG: hypothetical protein JWM95_1903 [Gemmatimonadetes bacterium]|nr:hypothetical protein [Gemmatimonadota bacterium]
MLRVVRETQRFGTIIIVGGGCYGSYYVRQLRRAELAGAAVWDALIVVDRNAHCQVATLADEERPTNLRINVSDWRAYFDAYLGRASEQRAETSNDVIVPSPLMPHLMADWLMSRAAARWPDRNITIEPLTAAPATPWERAGDDGTHYVSFADWMCPINCIEPARCPHTKGPRSWSMPVALAQYADQERAAGRQVDGPYVFHCTHRTHGVGMIDVREVVAADAAISEYGGEGIHAFLVGTASHCHGALRKVTVNPAPNGNATVPPRTSSGEISGIERQRP